MKEHVKYIDKLGAKKINSRFEITNGGLTWRKYPKTRQKDFLSALKEIASISSVSNVKQEEAVQAQWYSVLNYCFADVKGNEGYSTHIDKLLQTDGLLFVRNIAVSLNLITEFKADVAMDHRNQQERILGQVIYYLKHIQWHIADGNKLNLEMPNVVLAADANQVFVINARVLWSYLDMNLGNQWKELSPRQVYDNLKPVELFDRLHNDKNINPYVYDITAKDFDLNDVIGLVADLASADEETKLTKIPVNQANIRGVYDEFLRLVTQKKTKVASDQDLVSMFINALTNHDAFFIRNNTATLKHDNGTYQDYRVNGRNWYAFFSRFDTNYNSDEIKSITEVGDVLLEETARRFSGEYWTPTIWANEAINAISDVLGNDWKDKYYVWDASAGSKNLTRDFKFKNLFSSTLYDGELNLGKMFNRDNVAFQYDFLNDDVNISPKNYTKSKLYKLAPGLVEALLNNRPIVFYMNPPYASAGNTVGKGSKGGLAETEVNKHMNIGASSENLYAQFYYRILMLVKAFSLTNVVIAFFCKTQYMTGGKKFHGLKEAIFKKFDFKSGFLFNSGEFSDTAKNWGISFTVLVSKTSKTKNIIQNKFPLMLKDSTFNGIKDLYIHTLSEQDPKDNLADWVKEKWRNDPDKDIHMATPLFTSAFKLSTRRPKIYYPNDALGYAWFKGNMVQYGPRETGLFSADCSRERGVPITIDNFEKCMINFAIRKASQHTWINDKDNYNKPSEALINSPEYRKIMADCVVYSLFNTYSYQVSLSDVDYLGETYDIKNQFFWLSKDFMKKLANDNRLAQMGFDIDEDDERFVYHWLQEHQDDLSDSATSVLNASKLVIKDTFHFRQLLNDDYPEFCLTRWDAGWEQIRRIMTNGTKPNTYTNIFIPAYQQLENNIRDYIYDYGFLEK